MARPRSPKTRAKIVFERLGGEYPGTAKELCELDHDSPFQLLMATILSAQTTDARVNTVTPLVFAKWPDAAALAGADVAELEDVLHPTGFFRQKAKSVQGAARALLERHGGDVPTEMADLVKLPGVGRKTANVIRSVGLGWRACPSTPTCSGCPCASVSPTRPIRSRSSTPSGYFSRGTTGVYSRNA